MTDTHSFHSSILRAYDIRGIYEETLFSKDAWYVGKAFASAVIRATGNATPNIAVVFDGRLSTPELSQQLMDGIISTGATVWNFGLGPTPMMYFSVHHTNADAGVMVTGSHNPKTHNGFKLMLGKKSFFAEDITKLGEMALAGDFENGNGTIIEKDCSEAYVDVLAAGFEPQGAKPVKVVIDPGNGAAGVITERLVAKLDAGHKVINATIDGNFPNHHPDPTVPENMQQLTAAVNEGGYDFGIAFDGDGDRIGAVDKQGRILYGDQLMVLFSRDVLKNNPGATIIADVKASQTLFDDIANNGGNPVMWKTGHSLVKAKMKETGAKLAGEMSGHIFFADRYFGYDDGIYSAVRLINLMAHEDNTLETLLDAMPEVFNTPEIRIDVPDAEKFALVDTIHARLADSPDTVIDVDGVRVVNENGWWLARASNTQAAIIVRAEGRDAQALEALKGTIKQQLKASNITTDAL
ncbi:MAG: phosphomannomutase/phosphoglucomutase [Alphaproteobacteria bacterium]|nr:phosphomannomutase/phosphoglucomutase [Alphaproteobacteria bacterium]